MQIKYLKAFDDNYIWLIIHQRQLIVVDPGEHAQVLNYIIANNLQLKAILLTHDHSDHIGGVENILNVYNVPVYGNCNYAKIHLLDNQSIELLDDIFIQVILTPGHTCNSLCYKISYQGQDHLFCGDTLFASGCGRVFTGDYYAMYQSLNKIKKLSIDTLIYPAHEYTLKNLDFVKRIMLNSQSFGDYYARCENNYKMKHITLPTLLADELKFNPFLMLDDIQIIRFVKSHANNLINTDYEYFKYLRILRNSF